MPGLTLHKNFNRTSKTHSNFAVLYNSVDKLDPTRTLTLRQQFCAEMYKRFRWLKGQINKSIIDQDCFGYKQAKMLERNIPTVVAHAILPQNAFAFERNPKKVSKFMDWLDDQVNAGVLEKFPGQSMGQAVESAWTNTYIQTGYQKGILRARQELKNSGYGVMDVEKSPGGVNALFNKPIHVDTMGLVYTRAFNGLKGITDEMSKQISGVLAQGIADGMSPRRLAYILNDRVQKIGLSRARTLARTEVIRAHHLATINEYENFGLEGVKVKAEWTTAGYRVCPDCAAMDGLEFTLKEIRSMIPRHPNCRCLALPVDVTEGIPPKMIRKKKTVNQKIIECENTIKANDFETAVVFDKKGKKSLQKSGDISSVSFSQEQVLKMKEGILTHNHPRSTSFSLTDFRLLMNSGMKKMRIVTKQSNIFEIVSKNNDIFFQNPVLLRQFTDIFNNFNHELQIEFGEKILAGTLTVEKANSTHSLVLWKRLMSHNSMKHNFKYIKRKI